jgi:hypothetical protein
MSYKYHTPAECDQIIRETEAEMDRRLEKQAEADRLAKVATWVADPANSAQLAEFRAEMQRAEDAHRAKYGPQPPQQPQRPATPPQTPSAPAYKTRAQLEQEKPWLRDPKPGSYSRIIDPLVR